MKVLVTGATGYVGRALCEKLKKTDAYIHALCRSPVKARLIEGGTIRIFPGKLQDTRALEQAMEDYALKIYNVRGKDTSEVE